MKKIFSFSWHQHTRGYISSFDLIQNKRGRLKITLPLFKISLKASLHVDFKVCSCSGLLGPLTHITEGLE